MSEKFVPYHQHLLIKCNVISPPKDVNTLNLWFTDLVESVNMKVVAGPTSVYVYDEGNEGLTGTVTLATSHSSIHIWDALESPLVQFDIYSCKKFDIHKVMNRFKEWGLTYIEWIVIDRNEKLNIIDSGYNIYN